MALQVPKETAVRFVRGSHKMGWFTPRKFATKLNYERDNNRDNSHEFQDVPVDDIEGGKFGPSLSWATQPGDIIAFYGEIDNRLQNDTSSWRRILVEYF